MMEIKLVSNDDFMRLAELTAKMYKAINSNINHFQAVNTLVNYINNGKNFTAIGLYTDNQLVGMVTGVEFNNTTFYYTGIYMSVRNNEWLQKLIEFSFSYVKEMGYLAWEVDATNDNIKSIMEKYSASVTYTRYRKEFE